MEQVISLCKLRALPAGLVEFDGSGIVFDAVELIRRTQEGSHLRQRPTLDQCAPFLMECFALANPRDTLTAVAIGGNRPV